MHRQLQNLIKAIDIEEKEQSLRYSLDQQHSLKQLKSEGLALHPIIVTRKRFGYADYPEIDFKLNFPVELNFFKDGAAIECFKAGEEPVKGTLMNFDGRQGEFRIYAPDFPDWIEEDSAGIKLSPDTRTSVMMKKALENLPHHKTLYQLFEKIHSEEDATSLSHQNELKLSLSFFNKDLNASQQQAVQAITDNVQLCVLHGPPGTGKTTTLVEAILQLIHKKEKIALTAASNTAVDHISKSLLAKGVKLLRVGNTGKIDPSVYPYTVEGQLQNSRQLKEIKTLKKRSEEFRKMALKYKRSFGKAEREQRNLLFKEVKNIRAEIKKLQAYNEEKLYREADVIAGTPVGLYDAHISRHTFQHLIVDEAGQCIEPLAWLIFPLSERIVLAGDHLQLPPTVISKEAAALGLDHSILEAAFGHCPNTYLLNTQYRMRHAIAGFSSEYFYEGLLLSPDSLHNIGTHISFIDTAGTGYNEAHGKDGTSLLNEGELTVALKLLEAEALNIAKTAFISPYNGQVEAARAMLPTTMRISTIDSYQGQEKEIVILSLVRSNEVSEIGFLKDYRRMNVAITRAKEQLFVIGDSSTLGNDKFYRAFLKYLEKHGSYRTAWEFGIEV
ncbi:MAG: AAA family ATPase [Niastella sp.]|nr:AAA family ATPase [Niastella sp.]